MADEPALVAQSDLRSERELARLADVMEDRGGHQEIRVEPAVEVAGLLHERRDRDRVLEQPAEVGVVSRARARGAAKVGAEGVVPEERVDEPPEARVVDLAAEVLEEAV